MLKIDEVKITNTRELAEHSDALVREHQRMYGGETPVEVYERTLRRHADYVVGYGRDSGISLLLGRLCLMIEYAPTSTQTKWFFDRITSARQDHNVAIAEMMSESGRLMGSARTPAKAAAARENGKLGGRPRRALRRI